MYPVRLGAEGSNHMSEKYIRPGANISVREMDDEIVVMSVKNSQVFTLNPTASRIWAAADGLTPLSEIVARSVLPEFEVDAEVAYRDALALVDDLANLGILVVADNPIISSHRDLPKQNPTKPDPR